MIPTSFLNDMDHSNQRQDKVPVQPPRYEVGRRKKGIRSYEPRDAMNRKGGAINRRVIELPAPGVNRLLVKEL